MKSNQTQKRIFTFSLVKFGLGRSTIFLILTAVFSMLSFWILIAVGHAFESAPEDLFKIPVLTGVVSMVFLGLQFHLGGMPLYTKIGALTLDDFEITLKNSGKAKLFKVKEDNLTVYVDYRGYEGEWRMSGRYLYGNRNAITLKNKGTTIKRFYILIDSAAAAIKLRARVDAWKELGLDVRKTGRKWP